MPTTLRRVPSVDFRKAARLAELATKNEIESFSLEDDMESLYRSKIKTATHPQLRLSTSSPILSNTYQSDEEQISPQIEDFDETGVSEYESCEDSADELDFDGDDEEIEFEIEDVETVPFTSAMAIAVPFQKANLVDISILAPMAKRSVPISRPQSASYATFIKVKAPSPTDIRTSVFGALMERRPVRNFSTPLPRSQSLSPPGSLHSGTSPASSCLSLVIDSMDTSDAMIRGSDEIDIRSTVLTGTEWDSTILESPTPTSWAAYDPFALSVPTLGKSQTSYEDAYEKPKGWKRLGFTSKLLSSGKRSIRY